MRLLGALLGHRSCHLLKARQLRVPKNLNNGQLTLLVTRFDARTPGLCPKREQDFQ